jgi:apolipoprotein N-acyltransferase
MSLADQQPDIIILPEDVRYMDLQGVRLRQELSKAFPETVIVDGATRFIDGERKNTAIVFDIKTGTSSLRTKGVMFPFGETCAKYPFCAMSLALACAMAVSVGLTVSCPM